MIRCNVLHTRDGPPSVKKAKTAPMKTAPMLLGCCCYLADHPHDCKSTSSINVCSKSTTGCNLASCQSSSLIDLLESRICLDLCLRLNNRSFWHQASLNQAKSLQGRLHCHNLAICIRQGRLERFLLRHITIRFLQLVSERHQLIIRGLESLGICSCNILVNLAILGSDFRSLLLNEQLTHVVVDASQPFVCL